MRTSFHHQPEAQHPNFPLSTSRQADYPIFGALCGLTSDICDVRAVPFPDLSRCSKQQTEQGYSMTSSARPDSGRGMVMPSVLAVLRLMYSSTFVACCTGRSAGFSPLRIRPSVETGQPIGIRDVDTVTHQAPGNDKLAGKGDRGQCVAERERGELLDPI
jgi:hypothetical protein